MQKSENGLFQSGSGDSQVKNIKTLLAKYLRYWYLFVAGLTISLIVAFLHIRYNIVPKYYISSTLLIKEDSSNPAFSGGIPGGTGSSIITKNIGNEMVILRSKNLMKSVLSELSLNTSFFVEGRFQNVEVFQGNLPISIIINSLDPSSFGKSIKIRFMDNNNFGLIEYDDIGMEVYSKYKFGQIIRKPYATFTVVGSSGLQFSKDIIVQFQDVSKLADKYSQTLTVELESKEANVLRLGLIDVIPQRSVLILNKLVEVYNKITNEDKNQVELNTIKFLDDRIAFLSTELSDVEKDVEQFKRQNQLIDIGSNAKVYLETASEYNRELGNFELQLDIINSLENYIGQVELKLVPSTLNIQDPTLNSLIGKFNELQLERQRMLRTLQPSSSLILNIDDQLSNLKVNILENLRNIKNGLKITRDNLYSSSSQFQSKIRQVPSIERELLEINRQQSVKQAIYLFLLQSREEAGLKLASTQANSRVIDEPEFANSPVNASNFTLYITALSLGLLIPFGYIYLKEMFNDKVKERKDVEHNTNVPILGEIFHSATKNVLQITEGNHSVIAETFRLVRANLHFANVGKENKVILITSARSGEGKTFCSINLGATLALSGKKVVIVDFDLRKAKLMDYLGKKSVIGLTDYLVSPSLDINSLLVPIEKVEGLFAFGAGTLPPNPAELMLSPKVKNLIATLRNQYDYIILDSSPIGQVADTFSLAPFVDSTLFIVRYGYTFKEHLQIIEEIYQNKKLSNPMVVINDANDKIGHGYVYSYGYSNTNGNIKKAKLSKIEV